MTSIGVPARDRGSRVNTSTVIIAVQSLSTLTTTGFREIYSIAAIVMNRFKFKFDDDLNEPAMPNDFLKVT